ncbi:hypothetical protein NGB36_30580 [Streptomyces sp. RB6PN25]|uniref:Uncharacterized protein n=1 Tax=Streptomyces humicola TaxID=2953240 RepID=A0ABT1Q7L3_9ACTN|nr:hypothetical protein [Streptomyces humicola]MCQ4084800.1 hypothetical protein [Streptomyces humicola]
MTTMTTPALVPALHEVRDAKTAIANKFTTHTAVTPRGPYRDTLQRRVGDARGHIRRIDERLGALQRRGPLSASLGGVWRVTAAVVRMPFDVVVGVPAAALRSTADMHTLLKNAEEEYAVTAFAVATERAGERIADDADDALSLRLLRSIRLDDEELLMELEEGLDQQAGAVVVQAAMSSGRGGGAGRVGSVLGGVTRRWGMAEGLWQVAGKVTAGVAGQVRGGRRHAVAAEAELPIADYGQLAAYQITEVLPQLSQEDLAVVDAYERAHAGRVTILNRTVDLQGPEPWPDYDRMRADEIRARLRHAGSDLAQQALDYETSHRGRSTVLTAAAERAGA